MRSAWPLIALLAVATVLYGWNLPSSGYSDYYATAAKSMSESWKAFFFGAFDPQSTITLDKLAGFLVPQALSARVFGFSPWSLALPEVIEGLVTIAATYYVVKRWLGRAGGLIAAGLMVATPLLVSMFSHSMEDAMLTMLTVLAIAAWQRSVETDKRRFLLLAGLIIGVGFQVKMAQAWLAIPALAAVYLALNARPLAQKVRAVLGFVAVAVATSFAWMGTMAIVPVSQRPYIDGTTNNNVFSGAIGYNGIDRFFRNVFPGALGSDPLAHVTGNAAIVGIVDGPLAHTPLKFFLPQYATQIGWLFPLAAAGIVLGFMAVRRSGTLVADRGLRTGLILSTALLLTVGAVLSVMSLPHTAYLAALSFPLSALTAIGIVLLGRTANLTRGPLRFALPVTAAVQSIWSVVVISNFPDLAPWLLPSVVILGALGSLGLLARSLGILKNRRFGWAAIVTVAVAGLIGPLTWSGSTVIPAYSGTANDAYGGPPVAAIAARKLVRHDVYGIGLDSNRLIPTTAATEKRIYDYAEDRAQGGAFALATDTWRSAAPLIMNGAVRVLPMGGFTSRVPSPTLAALTHLVDTHELRFVLITRPTSKTGTSTPNLWAIQDWVKSSCRMIPPQEYWSRATTGQTGPPADTLYDCLAQAAPQ
ncbi:hypothetical protein G3T36_17770 [Diaminobutyricibacter tongyongensis]|uniref:Uncharacterized protein n=1 Tax=Leifsonia tongyongensis TaxID=1268043 RepID=A0A6L9Y2R3_9MICO|nr:glycosyltransferase family 39 protein [Diaminobutyricibacter tongyongensis]NEN07707.1 hypothetical protein [Diaminobutyricibacter tongyongensis]